MTRAVLGNSDIWLMDLARGGPTRLTFDSAQNLNPVWSPDGMRIAYGVSRKGAFDLFVKPSNGSRSEEVLLESPNTKVIQDWSRDGSFLLYYEVDPRTGRDLWAMELTGDQRQRRLVANTPFEETLAQLSPDGHWVAYQTNESGRFEIVVQSFPDAAGKWQVSTGGGVAPRWRADGREICFLAPDATMMAAAVSASGTAFQSGTPMALFQTRVLGGGSVPSNRAQYDIARDGRFLINQRVNDATAAPITLILNWHPERRP
jgi:Tol biopolymer transport system component